jgi:hypothetical protein
MINDKAPLLAFADVAAELKHACETGLEGVVSKVRDSRYVSGRVNDWVKKTCAQRETLAIAGFALDGKKMGWRLSRQARGQAAGLCRQGRLRLRRRISQGFIGAAQAADPANAALYQRKSRTAASGSSHRCLLRSNTERSPQREKSDIRFQGHSGGPLMKIRRDDA